MQNLRHCYGQEGTRIILLTRDQIKLLILRCLEEESRNLKSERKARNWKKRWES